MSVTYFLKLSPERIFSDLFNPVNNKSITEVNLIIENLPVTSIHVFLGGDCDFV